MRRPVFLEDDVQHKIDEFNLLDVDKMVEPCGFARAQLDAAGSERGFSVSRLQPAVKGQCVWCETPVPKGRHRWCSDACVTSAQDWCYPQTPSAKMRRLIFVQGCACAGCGESYEDVIRGIIRTEFERINRYKKPGQQPELLSLHRLGYGTGEVWQTDHIQPIFKGGKGIDPRNLQVLCVDCHDAKTKLERKL